MHEIWLPYIISWGGEYLPTSLASGITGQDFEDTSIFSVFHVQLICERFLDTWFDLLTQSSSHLSGSMNTNMSSTIPTTKTLTKQKLYFQVSEETPFSFLHTEWTKAGSYISLPSFLDRLSRQIITVFNNHVVAVTAAVDSSFIAFLISRFMPFCEI